MRNISVLNTSTPGVVNMREGGNAWSFFLAHLQYAFVPLGSDRRLLHALMSSATTLGTSKPWFCRTGRMRFGLVVLEARDRKWKHTNLVYAVRVRKWFWPLGGIPRRHTDASRDLCLTFIWEGLYTLLSQYSPVCCMAKANSCCSPL